MKSITDNLNLSLLELLSVLLPGATGLFFLNKIDTHNLIVKVVSFKNRDIGSDLDGYTHQTIDAYQYSYRRLMAEELTMFGEVERYYGTARFFRCMKVVLFLGSIIWLIYGDNKILSLWIFGVFIVSFFVFLNRWKKLIM